MQGRRERLRETTSDPAAKRRPLPDPRARDKARPSRRKRKVRKVHRVVRHVEIWSVLKMSTAFAACGYVIAMISGFLLWQAADRVGTINGIEGFMEDSGGYDSFEILGGVVFRSAAVIGLVLAALAVFTTVLGAVLFNLISDLTGGVRMTVIDEDLIVAPVRRGQRPNGRPEGAPPAQRT